MITYERAELDGKKGAYFTVVCKIPCGNDIADTHFPLIIASGSERLSLKDATTRAQEHQYDLDLHHAIFVEGWIASPDPSPYDGFSRVPVPGNSGFLIA